MNRLPLAICLALLLPAALLSCGQPPAAPEQAAPPAPAAHGPAPSDAAVHDAPVPEAAHAAAAHDTHDTHDTHVAAPHDVATPAQRWLADAALSRGMHRVRAATEALARGEREPLALQDVKGIAGELRLAVNDMIANCKLEPAPDAALHTLLARVLGASRTLDEAGFDAGALAELRAVLARYPELFDDAAWIAP